jgi:hypothetical protein
LTCRVDKFAAGLRDRSDPDQRAVSRSAKTANLTNLRKVRKRLMARIESVVRHGEARPFLRSRN